MRRFSLIDEPLEGFEARTPAKADLLAGPVAVLGPSVEAVVSLLDDFDQRVNGVVITWGEPYKFESRGPALWHLTVPPSLANVLASVVDALLEVVGRTEAATNELRITDVQLKRLRRDHRELQQRYQESTQRLESRIAHSRQAEETLKRTAALLQNVVDASQDMIFAKDRDLKIIFCNKVFARASGRSREALYGNTDLENGWDERLVNGDPARGIRGFAQSDRDALEGRAVHVTTQPIDENGRWYETIKVPLSDDTGTIIGLVGVSRDITDRHRAEEALRKSEEYLRITLHSIDEGVISTDTEGRVVRMNRVAALLTGWTETEARSRPLTEVFRTVHTETRESVPDPVQTALSTGETVDLSSDHLLIARDGTERRVADSSAPIRGDGDVTLGVVLVFRDVTDEYAMEARLRQSQKLEAIGQLAGGVAHDFNNMVGGIMGAAELLGSMLGDDPAAKPLVDLIIGSSERAAGLTNKLLMFARKQPAANATLDVHDIVRETVALLGNTVDRRIEIETKLAAAPSTVVGDKGQLQNALLNLGVNAAQAMPSGGRLTFETSRLDLAESRDDIPSGRYVSVEVIDTGVGIPSEDLDRIFEPFFTTKAQGQGTGLGLPAVFGTVRQHRGTVTVDSQPGHGSRFTVLLPLVASRPQAAAVAADIVLGEGLVLVVDDEPAVRTMAKATLERLGYTVLLAENGAQAVEIAEARAAEIAVVVLDMIMPLMNGRDCFDRLRKIDPELPVVLTTGFYDELDVREMKANGLAAFLPKPYRIANLSRVLADVARKRT